MHSLPPVAVAALKAELVVLPAAAAAGAVAAEAAGALVQLSARELERLCKAGIPPEVRMAGVLPVVGVAWRQQGIGRQFYVRYAFGQL